jgi:hypothetical protein
MAPQKGFSYILIKFENLSPKLSLVIFFLFHSPENEGSMISRRPSKAWTFITTPDKKLAWK